MDSQGTTAKGNESTRSISRYVSAFTARATRTVGYVVLLMVLSVTGLSSALAATNYVYDSLGRVVTVIYTNGSIIDYQYDANGNVTAISRNTTDALSIQSVAPTSSFIGSTITLVGSGFNSNPAQDTVTIGGASANVTAATGTTLVVTVPATVATGLVTVTVNGVTVTNSETITILRPTISSMAPAVVNAGNSVTLHGTNLDLVPGGTTLSVGSVPVTINSISDTQITFTAPSTSGVVTVSTSYGQVSTTSLAVLPSTIELT